LFATLANPNVVKVGLPKGTKDTKAKQNIVVSIDKKPAILPGHNSCGDRHDRFLPGREINKHKATVDTPTVVINADTSAYYGEVFRIMRLSKRSGAKVVANVK
jgi:biopolymer transport protein ExbD